MRIALHEKFRRRTHMEFKTLMFETIVQYRATNRYESPITKFYFHSTPEDLSFTMDRGEAMREGERRRRRRGSASPRTIIVGAKLFLPL